MTCNRCGETPCLRNEHEEQLRHEATMIDDDVPPNTARRMLYYQYTRAVHGVLGRGNRVVTPECVRVLIREIFPDPNGAYMGHRES